MIGSCRFIERFLLGLAKDHTLIRYDARGNGLSDWDVHEVSLDAWVSDMETVADARRAWPFSTYSDSRKAAPYRLPTPCGIRRRVSHLILFGGFALGQQQAAEPDGGGPRTPLPR
jgi:hypothetical protein